MENNKQTQAVAQQQPKPVDLLKSVIRAESVQQQFQNALGKHKDEFVASLIDLYTGDPQLQRCKPQAVVAEALRAATMRLALNKALGFAYIIVFNNSVKDPATGQWMKVPTPTFVPGYKGYIQLAMRTGQYRTINADMVYEGELRNVDKLSGTIAFDGEKKSDKVVGYFCYFELLNGFSKVLYMSVEDMAKYALRYSPSFKGKEKPTFDALVKQAQSGQVSNEVGWKGNFNDMALKTVIRRLLSKYGYLSIEMMNVIAKDDDEAMSDRNGLIAENANAEVLPADTATYEEIDPATGEIKESAADGGEAKQPDWA
ncbi:MAG: recombinase RecT [Bacteroidales bacterium]|nr:recombinase RecT [Bacteroidales bacterium]